MWQSRQWRYLLNRIDHLPRNSAYAEALSLDEELAEQMSKEPQTKGSGPRMRDWSPELEMFAAAVDRLGDLIQAVIAVQGGNPPQIKPVARPKTAWDKVNDPMREHHRTLSKVMIQQPDGSVKSAADM